VTVPPGGRGAPVRIAYRAVRGTRTVARRTRSVAASKGVARAIFKLPRSARRATLLRITAAQGTARATRDLRMTRRLSRPSAG
jgi:phosphatidylserine/phosphatidylglycerophosphate/cardiolipin synthase-like enzyme